MAWAGWLAVVHFHGFAATDQPTDKPDLNKANFVGRDPFLGGGGVVRGSDPLIGSQKFRYGCDACDYACDRIKGAILQKVN